MEMYTLVSYDARCPTIERGTRRELLAVRRRALRASRSAVYLGQSSGAIRPDDLVVLPEAEAAPILAERAEAQRRAAALHEAKIAIERSRHDEPVLEYCAPGPVTLNDAVVTTTIGVDGAIDALSCGHRQRNGGRGRHAQRCRRCHPLAELVAAYGAVYAPDGTVTRGGISRAAFEAAAAASGEQI